MQNKNRFLFFSLAGILMALLLSAASNPVSGHVSAGSWFDVSRKDNPISGSEQGSPCMALLMEAATKAGVKGTMGVPAHDVIHDGRYVCQVRFDEGGSGGTVLNLAEGYPTPEDSSNYSIPEHVSPGLHVQLTTFHGYSAMITYEKTEHTENVHPYTNESRIIYWAMYKGGRFYYLMVLRTVIDIEKYGPADPLPIANVLWSIAEDRLPLSEAPVEPALPVDPGEVVPGQPELPTDQTVPTDTGEIFGIPPLVFLGSLGIPVAGAVAGAVLSSLFSLLGTSSSPIPVSVPEPVKVNDLYWSERPWDEAGPGYVSKDEYERTKDMLAQGYKWKNGGWQTPDQIRQSDQWQQNSRAAVAREDEQFLKELEKNKERETPQQDLRTFDMRLGDFQEDLYALQAELEKTNYVLNPWQGDPTILIHKGRTLTNLAYDKTIGKYTGKQGLTCQDYVQETSNKTNDYLQKHFPGATVESMVFEERSSQADAKGFMNWLDSGIDDNHNLLRVKLPDGSELAVDFHQAKAGKAPLIRKWDEARKVWCDYLGEKEFMERTSYTLRGK